MRNGNYSPYTNGTTGISHSTPGNLNGKANGHSSHNLSPQRYAKRINCFAIFVVEHLLLAIGCTIESLCF